MLTIAPNSRQAPHPNRPGSRSSTTERSTDERDRRVVSGDWREQALADVDRYYRTYTGRRFETLGVNEPGAVTSDDLVAVTTLGIRLEGSVSLGVLDTHRDELSELLDQIPVTSIDKAGPSVLAEGRPAWRAWQVLNRVDGVGETIAGKILARKRPDLIPVFDKVVKRALGHPKRV